MSTNAERLYERRIGGNTAALPTLLPHLPRLQSYIASGGASRRDPATPKAVAESRQLPAVELPVVNAVASRASLNDSSSSDDTTPPPSRPLQRTRTEPHLHSLQLRRRTRPHLRDAATDPPTPTSKSRIQECVSNVQTAAPLPHPVVRGSVFEITGQKKNLSPFVPGTFQPLLAPRHSIRQRNLLVLDIDETLVHASVEPPPACDLKIPVVYKNTSGNVYVRIRPHVAEFLETVFELFDVVTFTASLSLYAAPLMDKLDPKGQLKGRFYREHCSNYGGVLVKDLAQLGWPLDRCVIIDNSPQAYALQPRNGIPIASFVGNQHDRELLNLLPLLRKLSETEDVYPLLDSFNSDL